MLHNKVADRGMNNINSERIKYKAVNRVGPKWSALADLYRALLRGPK